MIHQLNLFLSPAELGAARSSGKVSASFPREQDPNMDFADKRHRELSVAVFVLFLIATALFI